MRGLDESTGECFQQEKNTMTEAHISPSFTQTHMHTYTHIHMHKHTFVSKQTFPGMLMGRCKVWGGEEKERELRLHTV